VFDVYAATVVWDGEIRVVETNVADTEPLVGMGLIPGITGVVRPQALLWASLSRFGRCAVSSSDLPVSVCCSPPRPSATSRTIFEGVERQTSCR